MKPRESDRRWQLMWHSWLKLHVSVKPLFGVCVRVHRGLAFSSTALLSPGGTHKIRRTASWDHVLSVWWEKVLVQGRAHRDGSRSLSFPRFYRQMLKNRWQYFSTASFHRWEMQTWADHYGLMILSWLLQIYERVSFDYYRFVDAQFICTILVICQY